MHSHHSHSGQFCRHAAPGTTLEQSVLVAIERGLTTLGLSEHVPRYRPQDLYPEESDLSPDDLERIFDEYLQEAHRLKKTYQGRIDLLVGGETDYITSLDLERLEALLRREEGIEYLVGSVHHVEQHPIDFSEPLWRKCVASFEPSSSNIDATPSDAALTAYFSTYLDAQHTLLTRLAPPIIGHFDLCRLYIPSARLNDTQRFPGVWDRVVRNINHVIAYGGLFEVNAAAFRKGWETAYPGREILRVRPSFPSTPPLID
jgi:histidinol-phosphatase (PHP family)